MTPEQRKEWRKKNQELLAKKWARREALAAAKKGRKKSAKATEAEPAAAASESVSETPTKAPEASPEAPKVRDRVSLSALKARVKETWPKAKYMADAKREELAALLERGDAEFFTQYQETWAKRSKVRYEAWLKGDSKSAVAARTKQTTRSR
jgi:hypothetical protein